MNPTKLVCSEKELSKLSVTFSETSLIEKPAKEDKPLLEAHKNQADPNGVNHLNH